MAARQSLALPIRALSPKRRGVRAQAPIQFNKRSLAGRPGIESERRYRNLRRLEQRHLMRSRVNWEEIDNRRGRILGRCCRNRAKDFAALGRRRFGVGLGRLGVERATARRFILGHKRPQRAMIRDRDPGKDRDENDQATRGCSHADLIADAAGFLKCFLATELVLLRWQQLPAALPELRWLA